MLMEIMVGVIILSWEPGSTGYYAQSVSNRTRTVLLN